MRSAALTLIPGLSAADIARKELTSLLAQEAAKWVLGKKLLPTDEPQPQLLAFLGGSSSAAAAIPCALEQHTWTVSRS